MTTFSHIARLFLCLNNDYNYLKRALKKLRCSWSRRTNVNDNKYILSSAQGVGVDVSHNDTPTVKKKKIKRKIMSEKSEMERRRHDRAA